MRWKWGLIASWQPSSDCRHFGTSAHQGTVIPAQAGIKARSFPRKRESRCWVDSSRSRYKRLFDAREVSRWPCQIWFKSGPPNHLLHSLGHVDWN